MSYNLFYFSIFLLAKNMFVKVLNKAIFLKTLQVFLLGFPNSKMTSATLHTSFHIDFGRVVGD